VNKGLLSVGPRLLLAAVLVAACSSVGPTPTATVTPTATATTVPTVAPTGPAFKTIEAGVLVVATSDGDPPWNYRDTAGNPTGHDLDIITEIAKRLGLNVRIEFLDWTGALAAPAAGRADLVTGGMVYTDKRAEVMDMTDPYGYQRQDLTQLKTSNITSLEDLKDGRTIGITQGWPLGNKYKDIPWIGEKLKLYASPDDAMKDLLAGRVDCVTVTQAGALYLVATRPDLYANVKVIPIPVGSGGLTEADLISNTVFGINKADVGLKDAINAIIPQMYADGSLKAFYDKYGMWEANKP